MEAIKRLMSVILAVTMLQVVYAEEQEHADPLHDKKSSLSLLRVAGSDLSVANAARVSHNRSNDKASSADSKLIETLLRSQHETPFEQTFLQFHVKVPLFVARQWMRHRIGVSYNEQSARYTQMAQEFYTPDWRATKELSPKMAREVSATYQKQVHAASQAYEKLLAAGVKRELARCVLPVSLYTQFVFSCNLRSLLHFAQLRADSHAQWEIQQYAKEMVRMAAKQFPVTIKAWCALHKVNWLDEEKLTL